MRFQTRTIANWPPNLVKYMFWWRSAAAPWPNQETPGLVSIILEMARGRKQGAGSLVATVLKPRGRKLVFGVIVKAEISQKQCCSRLWMRNTTGGPKTHPRCFVFCGSGERVLTASTDAPPPPSRPPPPFHMGHAVVSRRTTGGKLQNTAAPK